jgi:anti-anti-sigma factor
MTSIEVPGMVTHRRFRRSSYTSLHTTVDPSRFCGAVAAPTVHVCRYWFGSWTILQVEGEMDIQARPLVQGLIGDEVSHVAFELDGVTFMDACGLGILFGVRRRLGETGVVQLIAPSPPVRRVMALTGSAGLFPTVVSADKAVAVLLAADPRPVA